MYATYDRSRMNNVCTVCPANFVGLLAKVVWLTAFFLKRKQFLYGYGVSHWLANLGVSS